MRQLRYWSHQARLRKMKKEDGPAESLGSRWMKIAGVVALYWYVRTIGGHSYSSVGFICTWYCRVISISMVFMNKYLLSSKDLKVRIWCSVKYNWFDNCACVLAVGSSILHHAVSVCGGCGMFLWTGSVQPLLSRHHQLPSSRTESSHGPQGTPSACGMHV